MTYSPTKPSDLLIMGAQFRGTLESANFWMACEDAGSDEYPIVVFNNVDGALWIASFQSNEEWDAWKLTGLALVNAPENAEPIDPDDADELAAQIRLIDWGEIG